MTSLTIGVVVLVIILVAMTVPIVPQSDPVDGDTGTLRYRLSVCVYEQLFLSQYPSEKNFLHSFWYRNIQLLLLHLP